MASRLAKIIAIVTGASSGLGRGIALAYAREGASIICADLQPTARNDTSATPTHDLINQKGGVAIFVKTDVREEAQIECLVAAAVKKFGRLDIMVNNAGIANDVAGLAAKVGGVRLHETPTETFDLTLAANTRGVFLGSKYALAQFLAQDPLPANSRGDKTRGWILNVASAAGIVALGGAPSYVASKHAVIGLTKQTALDYAKDKIHCNALCPAFVSTALISEITEDTNNPIAVETTKALVAAHPWGDLGQVEDMARAAVFLVSEDAQWITGHSLVVDGGYTVQ
ncbi:2-(R)-hydroxypropyl-CoM dehydrogenase [Lachnellula suecica]|uniref:2-(R)-hydroxypropyl-CoM dehydrogenase n=1 Tax=Lachnellula suecica TaxID=602035 RepID=A0A8T9CEP9_9HELO|nr:2-(R)-hydroxypropyl-CoM dehydrogenase [Lachnellula suecica]